jgi:ABC-type transport system involved in multi-copper enzyme maturation permease subunit
MSAANDAGLTGMQATLALARLAVVRASRGKALWIGMAIALLPLVVVGVRVGLGHERRDIWEAAFGLTFLTLPIVPSILIGPSLSDELEDKTAAYLWSRALPRWSIISGKLLGLAPVAAAIGAGSLAISWIVMGGPGQVPTDVAVRGLVGIGASAIAASALVAALATLVPRHAVAVSVVYLMFVDLFIGAMPVKLKYMSIAFGGSAIAGLNDNGYVSPIAGVATLVVISALGVTIAVTRIARME